MIMQLIVAKYYCIWKVGEFLSHKTKVQTVKNVNWVAYVKTKPLECFGYILFYDEESHILK